MRYVLDTNIVIAAMRGDARVTERIGSVETGEIGIPLLVVGELLYGARRSARVAENLAEVGRMRVLFPVLAVTEAVIERYGLVRAMLAPRGLPKGDFDLVIAATALEYGAVLVTHDDGLKDGAIPGLVVEDWLSEGSAG